MKLSIKLIVRSLIIALTPLIFVGIFAVMTASEALNHFGKEQLVNLRKTVIDLVNAKLDEQMNLLINASANDAVIADIVRTIESTGIMEMAQFRLGKATTVFHDKTIYENFFITDSKGIVIGDTSGGAYLKTDISQEEYFKEAIKGNTVIGHVVKAENKVPYLVFASPVRKKNNDIMGIIVSGWKLDALNRKIGELKFGKTGYVFVVDKTGMFIAHPNKEKVIRTNIKELKEIENISKEILSFQEKIRECRYEGADRIIAFAPVRTGIWSLGIVISESEYMTPVIRMRHIIFGAILTTVILVVIAVIVFVRNFSRPIRYSIREINESSEQISLSSEQIASGSRVLAEAAIQGSNLLENAFSFLKEIFLTIGQNAESTGQTDQLMTDLSRIITDMDTVMNGLNDSMKEIFAGSEKASEIIKYVNEIAFQTNLLGLNAAIEAARAGEAGAGFSVVADEIRNLGIRVSESAKTTSVLIEGISGKVGSGTQLLEKTDRYFREMSDVFQIISGLVRKITDVSQEQTRKVDQANQTLSEIDKVTRETSSKAEKCTASANEMNIRAERLKEIVIELIYLLEGRNDP